MPRRMRNLVRKPGRPGWYFRKKVHGRTSWIALGTDYDDACRKVRELWLHDGVRRVDLTVRLAAEQWLGSYVATARNEQGQQLAKQRVRDFLVPRLGHMLVIKVTADDLRHYRLALERGKLSSQSVAHVLSDARCLFRWLEDSGLVDRSPVPRRLLPRMQERAPDRLTDEEVELVCALPEPYGFLARVLVQTGLRWGELVRASTADIAGRSLVVAKTKSKKVRRVPLSPQLAAELRNRVGKLSSIKHACGFANQVRRRTGLAGFHAHQLRHSFACRWIEAGGSLAALQEILGHSSIVTTQRYGRIGQDVVDREAVRVYGKWVPEGVTVGVPSEQQIHLNTLKDKAIGG